MIIGIILFIVIVAFVFARIYMAHGCFFQPNFRDDIEEYMREHEMTEEEAITFINNNRYMINYMNSEDWMYR